MKILYLALIFCLLICGIRAGLPITWDGTVAAGDWSNANNWIGKVTPTVNDIVVLVPNTIVSVTSQVTVDQVTLNNMKLIVTNNAQFTVNNNFTQGAGTTTIQVDFGSQFNSVSYFIFTGGPVNFINFGQTLINPLVNGVVSQGAISNIAIGNTVLFQGTRTNLINFDFYVPSGFAFSQTGTQSFSSTGAATMTLAYTETVGGNGWSISNTLPLLPTNIVFLNGVNLNSAISLTNSGVGFNRPVITFGQTVTLGNSLTVDCTPVIGPAGVNSPVIFNGNGLTLTLNNFGVTINAPRVQGNAAINFNNGNAVATTAVFSRNVIIDNPNINFQNLWIFSGFSVTYSVPKTISFSLSLTNNNVAFLKPVTLSTGTVFINLVGGGLSFTDGIVSNTAITFPLVPVLDCTSPNKAFSISGNSQLTFPGGFTINGCALSTTAQLSVTGSITTNGGNTTLPSTPSGIVFNNGFTFSSLNNPVGSLNSITLNGQITVPNGFTYTANNVEVILPASPALTVSDNAVLSTGGNGLFTLTGGVSFGSGTRVTGLLAFNSGTPTITSTARVDFNFGSSLLLRNTIIAGTADIWYNVNTITATKGISQIQNPNFKFKGGINLNYLWDGFFPNTGCQLVINTGGVTGTRVFEGSVFANSNTNVVFDDNLNVNSSQSFTASNANPIGAVTFRTSGQAQAFITTNAQVTLSTNVFFNQTNFHLMGIGSYLFANTPILFVQGSLNNPTIAGDAIATATESLIVRVVSNSTFGNTIVIDSDLTTDDLDGVSTTAISKLTLTNTVTQSRNIKGAYTLGTDLTFGGNVVVQNGATINSPGVIEILGNSILLQASPTWRNFVKFPGAMTITASTTNTLTLGEQTPNHGLNIPSTFTVTSPASVVFNNIYTINFLTASTLGGTGSATFTNTFLSGSGAVTLSPQTLSFTNTSLVGTGSYVLNPNDNNLIINNLVRPFVSTVYQGTNVTLTADTTISNLLTFTANPLFINGGFTLTVAPGAYSVSSKWVNNNNNIIFNGIVTLALSGSFAGTGTLTFNNTLALSQSATITQNVVFGTGNNYIVTVSNGGFVLTLTSNSVTVNCIVVSNGGSIVSTSQQFGQQVISGGGVINSDWTWTNPIKFSNLNVTGARTLTFNLFLTSGQRTYFNDGVTFNGGTFVTNFVSDTPTLGIENSFTTNQATTIAPNIAIRITGTTFSFGGSSTLTLNGTIDVFTPLVFNTNVVFGYSTPTTGNTITLQVGCTGWTPSTASIQIWRTSFVTANNVIATITPSLIFGLDTITFTTSGPVTTSRLNLLGNLNVLGTAFTVNGNIFLGVISITSAQNNTLSGLNLMGTLTLISTTVPWVEPVVSINNFQQTLVLNGPARMNTPVFGPKASVVGPSRLAITNSLEVQSSFQFSAPVQLYITNPSGTFGFKLTNSQTNLIFSSTPSLFNPLGFNNVVATNFGVDSDNNANILKFNLNSPFNIGDLTINKGTVQFTGNSASTYQTFVAGAATLWIDGTAFTANQVIFNQNPDGSNPSIYQLTVSSLTPPAITTQAVVYKGIASVVVVNFNWDGTPVTGVTATTANANANFLSVIGSPGYQYTSNRNGNSMQFRRTANPSISPFPTQSNGPSPAVSSSSHLIASFCLLFALFIFFF